MGVEESDSVMEIDGALYRVSYIKRPFREGLEVRVEAPSGEVVTFGEMGLGEQALIERIRGYFK